MPIGKDRLLSGKRIRFRTNSNNYERLEELYNEKTVDTEDVSKPSLFQFLKVEVTRGFLLEHDEERYTKRREKVYSFMKIPREVEKFMVYGFFQQNWVSKLKETQEKWKKTLENTMFRAMSPQDITKQNAAEMSVNESMNSYFKTPSGASICTRSNFSVNDSSVDLCSTIERSSPLPESCLGRQSSGEDDSQSLCSSIKFSPTVTKHKKSF